jgi:hypothetical protein
MSDTQNKRELIDKCVALKEMPHVFQRIKDVWGYPEFFDTVDNLLMMEPGREARQGFPEGVHKEIDALKRIFVKFPEEVMAPELNEAQKHIIMQEIEDIRLRVNFSTGDRR